MAVRTVRRSFASPFVVTLAAALPAAACYVQPASSRPPTTAGERSAGTPDEPAHANPPRPKQPPMENMPTGSTTNAGVEQSPRPTPAPAVVAKQDTRWTITRAGEKCSAFAKVTCPTAPAGQPAPMCNPPPPTSYACTFGLQKDGDTQVVVQFAGQSTCQVEQPPIKCPPNTMCNPPPPQKVDCPK